MRPTPPPAVAAKALAAKATPSKRRGWATIDFSGMGVFTLTHVAAIPPSAPADPGPACGIRLGALRGRHHLQVPHRRRPLVLRRPAPGGLSRAPHHPPTIAPHAPGARHGAHPADLPAAHGGAHGRLATSGRLAGGPPGTARDPRPAQPDPRPLARPGLASRRSRHRKTAARPKPARARSTALGTVEAVEFVDVSTKPALASHACSFL